MFELPTWMGPWLLTYLVHSTVWLGVAWFALRLRPGSAPRSREAIWKTAMLGSLVSPTLAVTLFASSAPALLPFMNPVAVPMTAELATDAVPAEPAPVATPIEGVLVGANESQMPLVEGVFIEPAAPVQGSMPTRLAAFVVSWLPWIWLPIGILALGGMVVAHLRLWRVLRTRQLLQEGTLPRRLQRMLGALRPTPKIRLTVSNRIAVPVAFGWRRGEICLPERAVRELDPVQQSSMLGHELHHLLRRDPVVLSVVQTVARLLWMQPLNLVALRALRLSAEECCDAWAAGRTGDPVAMASCLGEVAGWLIAPRSPLPAACMARPGSPLAHRINRLLDKESVHDLASHTPPGLRMRATGAFLVGALILPTMLPATPFTPEIPALVDEALPLEIRTFVLAQEIDLIQAEIHALQSELLTRGDAGIEAARRLGALESRLTRLSGLLQEALIGLPDFQETPGIPVN